MLCLLSKPSAARQWENAGFDEVLGQRYSCPVSQPKDGSIPSGVTTVPDAENRWGVFFSDQWAINSFERRNPNAELSEIPWDKGEKAKAEAEE